MPYEHQWGNLKMVLSEMLGPKLFRPKRFRALLNRNPALDPRLIDDVIWGCVQQTLEQGFNVARFATTLAGLPHHVPAQTINRLCASSMSALHHATTAILADQGEVFLIGGVEHMGHVPMMHGVDFHPGLSTRMAKAAGNMGITAELMAMKFGISRKDQDEFALHSHKKATIAKNNGSFSNEMIPIQGHDEHGKPFILEADEVIREDANIEALNKLRPVFNPANGTVTAGNSSAISDGASAMLVMSKKKAQDLGLVPMAKVLSIGAVGVNPSIMGYGPVPAVKKVLKKSGLDVQDIDAFEINEAFAAQSLPCLRDLGLMDSIEEKVNLNGGAIALGHPLGCSGARISTTLLHIMKNRQKSFGVATMCVGMGQGVATVFESL